MKLSINFGLIEPPKQVMWWQPIAAFPTLVLHKNKKWEFSMYKDDPTHQVDYICYFAEVKSYDPNWHATNYENIDYLFGQGHDACECGAAYTSFPWDHMKYCPKWSKW